MKKLKTIYRVCVVSNPVISLVKDQHTFIFNEPRNYWGCPILTETDFDKKSDAEKAILSISEDHVGWEFIILPIKKVVDKGERK